MVTLGEIWVTAVCVDASRFIEIRGFPSRVTPSQRFGLEMHADHLPEAVGLIPSPEMREEEEEENEKEEKRRGVKKRRGGEEKEEEGDEENTGQQLRQHSLFLIPSSLTMESSLPF